MKKIFAVFILFFISLSLWAQDEEAPGENPSPEIPTLEKEPAPKKKFAMKNRIFEVSLANFDINISNNTFVPGDFIRSSGDRKRTGKFFKDSISISSNVFSKGFIFNFGAIIKPVSLNFNWKDNWGVGLDIGHINVTGNVTLSKNFLSVGGASGEKVRAGAAVFADFGIPSFFHIYKFKIKIRPSIFLPMLYTASNITYSQTVGSAGTGTRFQVNYNMRVYSAFDMQNPGALHGNVVKNLGFDLSLGAEYPLFNWLDIGVDITNIPLFLAKLNNYMGLDGEAFFDSSRINIADLISGGEIPDDAYGFPTDSEIRYYNNGSKKIYRPFTMLSYVKYRPFKTPIFTLIPSLGFSFNPLYARHASFEGGLSLQLNLANIFIHTIGINYNDRKWKNNINFILNFRAVELDFGVSFQSSDFVKSFRGAGLGVNAGLKLGW